MTITENAHHIGTEICFGPPARDSEHELKQAIAVIGSNPVVSALMRATRGIVFVLSETRQILAFSDGVLATLGVESYGELLGLRPGDALGCVQAREGPGGCGTSGHCSTCGAVIAMLTSLATNSCAEGECHITVDKMGRQLHLHVSCSPMLLDSHRFLLLFLQEIGSPRNDSPHALKDQTLLRRLTAREHEVLGQLLAGKSLKQIAMLCKVSVQTIWKRQQRILRKFGVNNVVELVRRVLSERRAEAPAPGPLKSSGPEVVRPLRPTEGQLSC